MSTPVSALLLLPDPPQRFEDLHDLWAALHPPLSSTVSSLRKLSSASQPATLDIALPILRLVQVFRKHRTLFDNVSVLLANVYSLLAFVYEREGLAHDGDSLIDARILLVVDDQASSATSQPLPCGTISFRDLSRFHRPWTHVFAVDGENGEAVYRSFRHNAAEADDRWTPELVRVPGGIQMYIQNGNFGVGEEITNMSLTDGPVNKDVYIVVIGTTLDFTDKYTLTMGLFSLLQSEPKRMTDMGKTAIVDRHMVEAISVDRCCTRAARRINQHNILNFLQAMLEFGTRAGEMSTEKAPPGYDYMDVLCKGFSGERIGTMKCCVYAGPSKVAWYGSVRNVIVAERGVEIVDVLNEVRVREGSSELEVVKVGGVNPDAFIDMAD